MWFGERQPVGVVRAIPVASDAVRSLIRRRCATRDSREPEVFGSMVALARHGRRRQRVAPPRGNRNRCRRRLDVGHQLQPAHRSAQQPQARRSDRLCRPRQSSPPHIRDVQRLCRAHRHQGFGSCREPRAALALAARRLCFSHWSDDLAGCRLRGALRSLLPDEARDSDRQRGGRDDGAGHYCG